MPFNQIPNPWVAFFDLPPLAPTPLLIDLPFLPVFVGCADGIDNVGVDPYPLVSACCGISFKFIPSAGVDLSLGHDFL